MTEEEEVRGRQEEACENKREEGRLCFDEEEDSSADDFLLRLVGRR